MKCRLYSEKVFTQSEDSAYSDLLSVCFSGKTNANRAFKPRSRCKTSPILAISALAQQLAAEGCDVINLGGIMGVLMSQLENDSSLF